MRLRRQRRQRTCCAFAVLGLLALCVQAITSVTASASTSGCKQYTVQDEPTLYAISRKPGMPSAGDLVKFNDGDTVVYTGKVICVSAPNESATQVPTATIPIAPAQLTPQDEACPRKHIVRAGEWLYGIATSEGTDVDTLKRLNPTLGAVLHPEDVLCVPGNPPAAILQGTPASTTTSTRVEPLMPLPVGVACGVVVTQSPNSYAYAYCPGSGVYTAVTAFAANGLKLDGRSLPEPKVGDVLYATSGNDGNVIHVDFRNRGNVATSESAPVPRATDLEVPVGPDDEFMAIDNAQALAGYDPDMTGARAVRMGQEALSWTANFVVKLLRANGFDVGDNTALTPEFLARFDDLILGQGATLSEALRIVNDEVPEGIGEGLGDEFEAFIRLDVGVRSAVKQWVRDNTQIGNFDDWASVAYKWQEFYWYGPANTTRDDALLNLKIWFFSVVLKKPVPLPVPGEGDLPDDPTDGNSMSAGPTTAQPDVCGPHAATCSGLPSARPLGGECMMMPTRCVGSIGAPTESEILCKIKAATCTGVKPTLPSCSVSATNMCEDSPPWPKDTCQTSGDAPMCTGVETPPVHVDAITVLTP